MRKRLLSIVALTVALWVAPRAVRACPSCAEAVPNSSGAEEEDQYRLARAYNNSIYLMAGMPYLLVGGVGYLVYRGLKRRALAERLTAEAPATSPPEGLPCPPLTAAGSSPAP